MELLVWFCNSTNINRSTCYYIHITYILHVHQYSQAVSKMQSAIIPNYNDRVAVPCPKTFGRFYLSLYVHMSLRNMVRFIEILAIKVHGYVIKMT